MPMIQSKEKETLGIVINVGWPGKVIWLGGCISLQGKSWFTPIMGRTAFMPGQIILLHSAQANVVASRGYSPFFKRTVLELSYAMRFALQYLQGPVKGLLFTVLKFSCSAAVRTMWIPRACSASHSSSWSKGKWWPDTSFINKVPRSSCSNLYCQCPFFQWKSIMVQWLFGR